MDRNLIILKTFPFFPVRLWVKKIGPKSVNLINGATIKTVGIRAKIPIKAINLSNIILVIDEW